MQLLEQLAEGTTIVAEYDVLLECASAMGYFECIDDLVDNGIVTESVVLEGLDIKGFVLGILRKIKEVFKKISDFFRRKKMKSTDSKDREASKDKSEDKSEEQAKEDWLKANPFKGNRDPGQIALILVNIKSLTAGFISSSKSSIQAALDYLCGDKKEFDSKKYMEEISSSFIGESIGNMIHNYISSWGDIAKVPTKVYDLVTDGKPSKVLVPSEMDAFTDQLAEAAMEYNDTTENLAKSTMELSNFISRAERTVDAVETIGVETDTITPVRSFLLELAKCVTGYGASLTEVYGKAEKDISDAQEYLRKYKKG